MKRKDEAVRMRKKNERKRRRLYGFLILKFDHDDIIAIYKMMICLVIYLINISNLEKLSIYLCPLNHFNSLFFNLFFND